MSGQMTPEDELDEPSFPQSFVVEALKALGKAIRAYQLYLPNNPMHARSRNGARGFASLWTQTDSIVLQISETQFLWEGRPVFEEGDRTTDSLPWTFYKDGIRELRIESGFEAADLALLLDILQKIRKASADDDDLLTMMWEAEFSSLHYKYTDLGAEGGSSDLEGLERGEKRERIMAPAQAEADTPLRSSVAKMEDYDSTLYFLDDREIEYLQGEIKRDFSSDLRGPVLASLFDTFERERDPTVREEICGILDYFLLVLLSTTQFRTAAYLLREAGLTAERAAEILQPQRQRLTDLAELLSDPSALSDSYSRRWKTRHFVPRRSSSTSSFSSSSRALSRQFSDGSAEATTPSCARSSRMPRHDWRRRTPVSLSVSSAPMTMSSFRRRSAAPRRSRLQPPFQRSGRLPHCGVAGDSRRRRERAHGDRIAGSAPGARARDRG